MTYGKTIRQSREQKGMTQEELAERLGVSRQAVSKWENGTVDPSTSNLLALAKLYGLSPEALLQNVDPAQNKKPNNMKEDTNV